jgi:hypothetical protein
MKPSILAISLAAATMLAGCSDEAPTGDPAKRLRTELRGYDAPIGVLMGANEKPYWVQSAVAGFRPARKDDYPAVVETMKYSGGCKFMPPRPDELVEKVHVDSSRMQSAVYVASRDSVGERTKQYIENYKAGQDIIPANIGDDRMGLVDVIVTETSKPIYLVLAYSSSTIFNVQLAPGAKLSRVALVGHGAAGVANVDPSVPMAVLNGRSMEMCGVSPIREPKDHWAFVRNVKEDPNLKEALAKNYGWYGKFSGWYRENFGVPSEPDSIGASEASHVLVGPLPDTLEARVPFKSLEGSRLVLSKTDFAFVGSASDYDDKIRSYIIEQATRAAGGDLKAIAPSQ